MAEASPAARVSPAVGFWIGGAALTLFIMDAVARMQPGPMLRLALLAGVAGLIGATFATGVLDHISILQEYAARRAVFWTEGGRHLTLAFGSFLAAMGVGVPLGILCQRKARAGGGILGVLTLIQTIPSIALFGMLILPLGWVAAHVPGARMLGIGGIGMTPALVALFLYALLPVVANTVAGLNAVPATVVEAARGMGFTKTMRLRQVDLPLALPIILTGARIVLVQGIGLATVGALIGAGGYGTFVFQGLGQTAPDLILLGALPTVALAFCASIILGAVIDLTKGVR
nr:ABC transporter permease [Falsirhodobacter halotolerans]